MKLDTSFATAVQERSGENLPLCYQCLKCTAGCPLSSHMDFKPSNIIRMIQYGQRERVLKSHAIWFCISCMTCGVRCPNEVDISALMDTLREMAIEAGYAYAAEKKVVQLHEEFVRSIKLWGRLHEVTFYIGYMARSLDILASLPAGLTLLARGKLPFLPKGIKGAKQIKRLYKKAYKTKGQLAEEE
ncbi:MAG: 4Fe-4S dicluster domain-containing protein [Candidatus Bipolaricaulia bacterium]